MREICFDTETTGLDPLSGDKLVEIGAVELINHLPTGVTFHEYINPERDVPEEVVKVHGLTNEFLADKPTFAQIAQKWVDFIGDDGIFVAHNAEFDMKFINHELQMSYISIIFHSRFRKDDCFICIVIDMVCCLLPV